MVALRNIALVLVNGYKKQHKNKGDKNEKQYYKLQDGANGDCCCLPVIGLWQ